MKSIFAGMIALVLLFGCAMPEAAVPEKEDLEIELQNISTVESEGYITVTGNDTHSIVTIRAAEAGGGWQFPLQDYDDEFLFAGLHSDSFIRLDNTQIPWLRDGEEIWLTPMVRTGNQAILFNAIYSIDLDCDDAAVPILGKVYSRAQLRDGSAFEGDDKWKVAWENEGCPARAIVYLDGYFYDMKDGEEIPLFKNDGTVSFRFERLDSGPVIKVIATEPEDFQ